MKYFITLNNQTIGPMTAEQIMAYPVNSNTPVSEDGGDWRPLYTYPNLMEMMQNHGRSSSINSEISSKKTLCGVLAIVVGSLGIQYFVLGKTAGGIYTILLSLITCGAWSIITLIQGILMLCMSDEDFKRKYIDSPSTFPIF